MKRKLRPNTIHLRRGLSLVLVDEDHRAVDLMGKRLFDIDLDIRCVTEVDVKRKRRVAPTYTRADEEEGDFDRLVLAIYHTAADGRRSLIGGIQLVRVTTLRVRQDGTTLLRVMPSPGMGKEGRDIWGRIGSDKWARFLITFMKEISEETFVTDDEGNFKVLQWEIPSHSFNFRPELVPDTEWIIRESGDKVLMRVRESSQP